jgi:hypothetical protein
MNMSIKLVSCISSSILVLLLIYVGYLHSPWTPSVHSSTKNEITLVSTLSKRKDFADNIIQEYSTLPKNTTQEIRTLYEDARENYNAIIELFGLGADGNSIPIDSINNKVPEAEQAYRKLVDYIAIISDKQKKEPKAAEPASAARSLHMNGIRKESSLGETLKALNEIVGKREIYSRISKRVQKYRWDPFPVK